MSGKKYKIETPVKGYTGKSASVSFADGVGYTDKPDLVQWFRSHGYKVTELGEEPDHTMEESNHMMEEPNHMMEEPDSMPEPEEEPDPKPKGKGKKA